MGGLSRTKGANAERAVANLLTAHGLAGIRVIRTATDRDPDHGDVHALDGRIVIQVKAGEAAKTASLERIRVWWDELGEQMSQVPQCDQGLLVLQRRGIGMGRPALWDCWYSPSDLLWWRYGRSTPEPMPVSMAPLGKVAAELGVAP